MVGFLLHAGSRRRNEKGLGQKRSPHIRKKRNHKTQPLIEGKRFIFSLGFFFLMKS